jgi:hypothetical protein
MFRLVWREEYEPVLVEGDTVRSDGLGEGKAGARAAIGCEEGIGMIFENEDDGALRGGCVEWGGDGVVCGAGGDFPFGADGMEGGMGQRCVRP